MLIDFSSVFNNELKLDAFSQTFTIEDFRNATSASIDRLLAIIQSADDAQVTFVPFDPNADDQYAVAGEEHIGWSLAHLVAHVTATCEEDAATASILARGIHYEREPRLRYETPWKEITTQAQTIQRLEESRRIRLGYLLTFPDQPFWDNKQVVSERYSERFGEIDPKTRFLLGLYHEWQHYDQFVEVARQAREGATNATNIAEKASPGG